MRLQNDEYVKGQSKLSFKSTTDTTKEEIKKRMEEIDAELMAIKKKIAPMHPQSYSYRAVNSSEYAKDMPSDILNSLKQDVYKHFNESKERANSGRKKFNHI